MFKTTFQNKISNGMWADIRFFPRRGGIFQGKGVDGTIAWQWIRDNAGVGMVDHGFRIKPYGFIDDDWLNLDTDHSISKREWRTQLMNDNFEMSDEQKRSPSLNPMLNIPVNTQLVGAVFVESRKKENLEVNDLIPAMDREGFLVNQAFRDIQQIVRAGIEFLALKDKEEELERAEKKAKEATRILRRDIRYAIQEVEQNPTIPKSEKNLIVGTYSRLAEEIENVDEYYRNSRANIELIGLLGIVSGYMTHESEKILSELKTISYEIENLAKEHPKLIGRSKSIKQSIIQLEGQIGYATDFVRSIHSTHVESFNAKAQIEYILDKFGAIAIQKNIEQILEIDELLRTPPIHIAIYSGVFLNLYTNAIKAILMKSNSNERGKILVRVVNIKDRHILEVFDNGVGIPESLHERIWDPLFSTTSKLNSPLGTGMGLGLSLVKKIVNEMNGTIRLVDPIKDYVTAFRVEYPFSLSIRR
jgi:signal transduction histidine kinase